MSRRVVVALLGWATVVAVGAIFMPGTVFMCLGPLGVTEASCRAANGLPPITEWDLFVRSPGPVAILFAVGGLIIIGVPRWRRRRGGL